MLRSDLKTKRQGNEECLNQTCKQKAMEWRMLGSDLQTKGNGVKNAWRMLEECLEQKAMKWRILEFLKQKAMRWIEREREREFTCERVVVKGMMIN